MTNKLFTLGSNGAVHQPPAALPPALPAVHPRPRRLRRTPQLRALFTETRLDVRQLIHPLFVLERPDTVRSIEALPGHAQLSVDRLDVELDLVASVGIPAVLLFGIPEHKDALGSAAWDAEGPVPRAIARIKARAPHVVVIADVCLCAYTSHGHCGVVDATGSVLNDPSLDPLTRAALAYADAGADIVAPSAMIDRQVAAIRSALDSRGHESVAILSYAAKFASAFYGPFREAAGSAPAFGDRRSYQLPSTNPRDALREVVLDETEGADLVMVKPASPYLDVIRLVRESTLIPVAAYQTSGEYAMLKAAGERGWIDERAATLESLTGIRRAGADLIITYAAKDVARWLREEQ